MKPNQWEIITLKPTPFFLSFLTAQFPDINLPELSQLQRNNTAYLLAKQANDEETLHEIERHFTTMFHHEIYRWVEEKSQSKIEGSFLDFLCCFKFELYANTVLSNPSSSTEQQLLRIKPRSVLLKWLKSASEEQNAFSAVLNSIKLSHVEKNETVIIKNFTKSENLELFVEENYQSILAMEMQDNSKEWPKVESYQAFQRYYTIDVHSQIVHLH